MASYELDATTWRICTILCILLSRSTQADVNTTEIYKPVNILDVCNSTITTHNGVGRIIYTERKGTNKDCRLILESGTNSQTFILRFLKHHVPCPNQLIVYNGNDTDRSRDLTNGTHCGDYKPTVLETSGPTVAIQLIRQTADVQYSERRRIELEFIYTTVTTGKACNTSMNSGDFMCHDKHRCVDRELTCDGYSNCPDGSDEEAKWAGCPVAKQRRYHIQDWMIVTGVLGTLLVISIISASAVFALRSHGAYEKVT